ncbi:MAG: carboxypeptidase-like regulatory domain-containing protein, partial [Gammaproteobacteria bacterium]|nr:carboxypeptidase-like regulatory domain-containing protein [Gammaproteobacteria bacterium]
MQIKEISSLITLGALLTLSGCGSSDNTNPLAGETVQQPVAETITISGQVTDMPIANAAVMVTVDGQTFQAPLATDAAGNYEVEISSNDPDALVMLEAFGPNGVVRFTALVGSYAGLRSQADASGNVPDNDITNVTTALYILATRADSDGSIDNADELTESAALVDADAALQLSAAIKLVVESIAGVTLPPEYTDTQELAEAIADGSSTFIDDVAAVAPAAMGDAVDLVVNDGNATIAWQQDSVPGVYLHRDGFSLHALFADGTGLATSYDSDDVRAFQWAVNADGKLVVVYLTNDTERDVVTLLSRTGNVLTVTTEEQGGQTSANNSSTVTYLPFTDGFSDDNVPGSYSTMGESGHIKVLQADHTGYDLDLRTGVQDDFFVWETDSDGTLYIVDTDSRNASQARVLGGAEDGGMHLLITETGADGLTDHLDVITVRRVDTVAASPTDVDAPDLLLAGNAYAFVDGSQIDVFRFRADGEVHQVAQHTQSNGNLELVDRRGEWTMVDDQTIRIWLDGQDEAEDAVVVAGLGEDEMLVRTPEDFAAGTERFVTRIIPLAPNAIMGGYYLLDENGSIRGEFVEMRGDLTGHYYVNGVLDRTFDWSLDEHGSLVICLRSGDSFQVETLTMSLLAGGTPGEAMRLVVERRVNGML